MIMTIHYVRINEKKEKKGEKLLHKNKVTVWTII